jgi:hypothetical protein
MAGGGYDLAINTHALQDVVNITGPVNCIASLVRATR